MTISISAAAVAKAASLALSDEKTRKKLGWLVVAIFSPVIIVFVILLSFLQAGQKHNTDTANYVFHGSQIPFFTPSEFGPYADDMRQSFLLLDSAIAAVNEQIEEDDGQLNAMRIKSVFYSLYFGRESPSRADHRQFVDAFVEYVERTREVEVEEYPVDELGNTDYDAEPEIVMVEETYTAIVPVRSLATVYTNIGTSLGIHATFEQKTNAQELYYRIAYDGAPPDYGSDFDDWLNSLELSEEPFVGADGFTAPVGGDWRAVVSSEFGRREDPIDGEIDYHTGIDLKGAYGSDIYAALDGTVLMVRHSDTGYGNHVAIDHGGGFVTLYAHCSSIKVTEGETVKAGQVIAGMGNTGRVTGIHLHFEVRESGTQVNPRNYLP